MAGGPVREGGGRAAEQRCEVGADALLGGCRITEDAERGVRHGLGHERQQLRLGFVAGQFGEPDGRAQRGTDGRRLLPGRSDGLVVRTYHPEVPPRVEYEISELGRSLGPLFASLATWSAGHLGAVEEARQAYDTAESP